MTTWKLFTESDGYGGVGYVAQPHKSLWASDLDDRVARVKGEWQYTLLNVPHTGGRLLLDMFWDDGWTIVGRGVGPNFGEDHGTFQVAVAPSHLSPADAWATILNSRDNRGWIDPDQLPTADPSPPHVNWDAVEDVIRQLARPGLAIALSSEEHTPGLIWGLLRMMPSTLTRTIVWSTCHLPAERVRHTTVTGTPAPDLADAVQPAWSIVARAAQHDETPTPSIDLALRWLRDQAADSHFQFANAAADTVTDWLAQAEQSRPRIQRELMAEHRLYLPYEYQTSPAADSDILNFVDPPIEDLVRDAPALGRRILNTTPNQQLATRVFTGLIEAPLTSDPFGLLAGQRGPGDGVTAWLESLPPEQRATLALDAFQAVIRPEQVKGLDWWLRRMGVSEDAIINLFPVADQASRIPANDHSITVFARAVAESSAALDSVALIVRTFAYRTQDPHWPLLLVRRLLECEALSVTDAGLVLRQALGDVPRAASMSAALEVFGSMPDALGDNPVAGLAVRFVVLDVLSGGVEAAARKWATPRDLRTELTTPPEPFIPPTPTTAPRSRLEQTAPVAAPGAPPAEPPPAARRVLIGQPLAGEVTVRSVLGQPAEPRRPTTPSRWNPLRRFRRDQDTPSESVEPPTEPTPRRLSPEDEFAAASRDAGRASGLPGSARPSRRERWQDTWDDTPGLRISVVVIPLILIALVAAYFVWLRDPDRPDPSGTPVRFEAVTTGAPDTQMQLTDGKFPRAVVTVAPGARVQVRGDTAKPYNLNVDGTRLGSARTTWLIAFYDPGFYTVEVSETSQSMGVRVRAIGGS